MSLCLEKMAIITNQFQLKSQRASHLQPILVAISVRDAAGLTCSKCNTVW